MRYLGHVVGSGKHSPDPERVEAIAKLVRPKPKRELRSVLGLCNYYRDYVVDYANVVYPLTELTARRVPNEIPWGPREQSSFNKLKECLVRVPSLYAP